MISVWITFIFVSMQSKKIIFNICLRSKESTRQCTYSSLHCYNTALKPVTHSSEKSQRGPDMLSPSSAKTLLQCQICVIWHQLNHVISLLQFSWWIPCLRMLQSLPTQNVVTDPKDRPHLGTWWNCIILSPTLTIESELYFYEISNYLCIH
jgi:hypothetical protein